MTTDAYKDALVAINQHASTKLTNDEIDALISFTKSSMIAGIVTAVAIDFIIRFLVIDSLYHKYREERKPNQVV